MILSMSSPPNKSIHSMACTLTPIKPTILVCTHIHSIIGHLSNYYNLVVISDSVQFLSPKMASLFRHTIAVIINTEPWPPQALRHILIHSVYDNDVHSSMHADFA